MLDEAGETICIGSKEYCFRPVGWKGTVQQQILAELCAPLLGDGDGLSPAADDEIAEKLGTDQKTVTTELEHLARSFGLSEMPFFERRAEIAILALRSGLVKPAE